MNDHPVNDDTPDFLPLVKDDLLSDVAQGLHKPGRMMTVDMMHVVINRFVEEINRQQDMAVIETSTGSIDGTITGYLIRDMPCDHDRMVWKDSNEWTNGVIWCASHGCIARYNLVFHDGRLTGVKPYKG